MTMSESIRLAVRPETAHLAPGDRLVFLLALENRSSVAEHCLIAVRGLRADWYSLDRPSVLLGSGVSTSVRLAVHPPDAPTTVGRYPIVVQVVSEDTPSQRTSRDIEVIVDVGGGVRMALQPAEVAGPRGTLQVTLRNDTEQSESVALLTHSDDEARIRVEPAGPIVVPGGGTASALVHVTARPPWGRPTARLGVHEIEVRGVRVGRESVDDPLLVRHAHFVEGARPAWLGLSGWRAAIGVPLLAVALALFAGVVLLRPRSSHAPRPTAAPVALNGVAPGVFPTRNPTFPSTAAMHGPVRATRRPALATGSVAAGPLAASATPSRPTPSPHVVLPARPTPSPHVVLPARPTPFRTPTPHAQPVARDAAAPSPRPRVRVASVDRARHTAPLRVRAARSILTMARARPSVRRTASALHDARVSVGTQGRTRRRVTGVRVGTASSHVRRGRVARGVPRHSARGVPRHSARGVPRHSARGVQGGTRRRPPQRSVVRGVGRRQTYALPYRTHLRRGGRPAVADVRRTVLRVAWPSDATLRFSHLETLRLTAAPGALIVVTLRVRVVERGVGGRRIAQIYRYTTQARADHFGRAALPLRYAYVPTQPASGSLAVVAYAGRTVTRRSARIVLVYR